MKKLLFIILAVFSFSLLKAQSQYEPKKGLPRTTIAYDTYYTKSDSIKVFTTSPGINYFITNKLKGKVAKTYIKTPHKAAHGLVDRYVIVLTNDKEQDLLDVFKK